MIMSRRGSLHLIFIAALSLILIALPACSDDKSDEGAEDPADIGEQEELDAADAADSEAPSCAPGAERRDGCDFCECQEDGTWVCLEVFCEAADVTEEDPGLADAGKSCEPGAARREDCNYCGCGDDGVWVCTQRACEQHDAGGEDAAGALDGERFDDADTLDDADTFEEDVSLVEVDAEKIEGLVAHGPSVVCEAIFECCTEMEVIKGWMAEFLDEAACLEKLDDYLSLSQTPLLVGAIERGRVVYDEQRATDCLQAWDELSCDDVDPTASYQDCVRESVEGVVEEGEACDLDLECASGVCVGARHDEQGAVTNRGICRGDAQEGEECYHEDGACAEGLFCSSGYCVEIADVDQDCSRDTDCLEGLFCDAHPSSSTRTYTCQPYRDIGGECFTSECGPDKYCDQSAAPLPTNPGACAEGSMCNEAG